MLILKKVASIIIFQIPGETRHDRAGPKSAHEEEHREGTAARLQNVAEARRQCKAGTQRTGRQVPGR